MYTFAAILITAALAVLTILGARCTGDRKRKKYLFINLGIAGGATVFCGIIPFLARAVIFGGDSSEEWQGWAWDAFMLYLKSTLPVLGVCLALILATAVVTAFGSKKANLFSAVIRQSVSVAVSVILLFLAPFYSAMAETGQGAVSAFILIFGIGEALLMRWSFVLEMAVKLKQKR